MKMDPSAAHYRFIVLGFTCLLSFGPYYCFDMPSVLQAQLQEPRSCSPNATTCSHGLGLSGVNYNLLYAVTSWTSGVGVVVSGLLLDRFGTTLCALLFTSCTFLGSSIFALGSSLSQPLKVISVMLAGRIIFGAGNSSVNILQFRLNSIWFKDKELATAFGTTVAFSRVGSVLNFFLTAALADMMGLTGVLWFGACLCLIGLCSAVVVSALDNYGQKKLNDPPKYKYSSSSGRLSLGYIRNLPATFWLICLGLMFFYGAVYGFIADAANFIKDKYGYEKTTSAVFAGSVYDVGLILSPLGGLLIDKVGRRGLLVTMCAILTLPVFLMFLLTNVHPLVPSLLLGVTYSVAASAYWSSIPIVVPSESLSSAMGLAMGLEMIMVAITNILVGVFLGDTESGTEEGDEFLRWRRVMLLLTALTLAWCGAALALYIVDKFWRGGQLNKRKTVPHRRYSLSSSSDSETSLLVDNALWEGKDEEDVLMLEA